MAVTVYSTPTCPSCKAVKKHLRDRRVRFRDVDVSRDERAAAELRRKTGRGVIPVVDVNGRIVVGFDRKKLDAALGVRG